MFFVGKWLILSGWIHERLFDFQVLLTQQTNSNFNRQLKQT